MDKWQRNSCTSLLTDKDAEPDFTECNIFVDPGKNYSVLRDKFTV